MQLECAAHSRSCGVGASDFRYLINRKWGISQAARVRLTMLQYVLLQIHLYEKRGPSLGVCVLFGPLDIEIHISEIGLKASTHELS